MWTGVGGWVGQVQDQRKEAVDPDADGEAVDESPGDLDCEADDDKIRAQAMYYETVHQVKEHVRPAPTPSPHPSLHLPFSPPGLCCDAPGILLHPPAPALRACRYTCMPKDAETLSAAAARAQFRGGGAGI